MAVFPSFKLTEKGEELLNRSIGEGKTLTFTKFELGDGNPPSDFRKQTGLVNKFYEFPILNTSIQKDQVLRIRGYFDNKYFSQDKQLKEIGVFVKIEGNETQYLYSYTNAGDTGDIIPANSRGFYSRTLDVANYIGYATNITFNIEQLRDRYAFNTENEMKVASYLKAGDKLELWGNLVLGDKPTDEYIIQESGEIELSNGLFAKKVSFKYIAQTIEEIQKLALKVGDIVEVLGYYQAGDGAGHKRKIESEDDGSGVLLDNGLYANIVHNGEVNVSWFGAKGDGVTDDTEAIQKAINYSENIKLLFPDKTYLLTKTLTLKSNLNISGISTGSYSNSTKLVFDVNTGDCINGGTDSSRISYIELRNITISTKQPKVANGVSLYATYTKLGNILVTNCLSGIYLNGWYSEINSCKAWKCENGIQLKGNACVLSNSFAQSSTNTNIFIIGRNLTVFNNDFASYDNDNTQIGFRASVCYGCNVFANYFEGYAQTMVKLNEIGASNFSNFEISEATTTTEKTMKLFDIDIFRTSVLDGFYLEPNALTGQLKLDLGNIIGSHYSEIKNIKTKAIKGFKVLNSFILFDNIVIDNIEDCEYSFNFNRHDYVRCTFNNIPETHFSKMQNLEYISGRSKVLLINDRHSKFDTSSINYSILGDTTYRTGYYPNNYFMLNTGSDIYGWLGTPLMDKYMRLDTPYWRDIMTQAGVWEDLVTYLNAKRKSYSVEPSEKLKQFCLENNIE